MLGADRECAKESLDYEPLVQDGYDSSSVDADLFPSGLSHVEMLEGRVAPPTIVIRESVVWRAEVGGGDRDGNSFDAPPRVGFVVTDDPVALPTRSPVIEQCSAQCGCSGAVPGRGQVPIATSSSCTLPTNVKLESP